MSDICEMSKDVLKSNSRYTNYRVGWGSIGNSIFMTSPRNCKMGNL